MRKVNILLILTIALIMGCKNTQQVDDYATFIKEYESKVIPLVKQSSLAYFEASISGKDEDYQKSADMQIEITKIFSNKALFEKIKTIKESEKITNEVDKRRVEVLYNAFLSNQVDTNQLKEIINLQTEVEKKFSTFRADVAGKKLTDNEIEDILRMSKDSKKLEEAWRSSKKVGTLVSDDVIKLAKKRNEIAKSLGYDNYHQMSLMLSEQNPKEIEKIFDELDALTKDTYIKVKSEMDAILAKELNIKPEQLMPWHYQNRFFQEAPKIYNVDLDKYYQKANIEKITKDYYNGIGLPIDDILAKSDLYEKPNKYQHAYCIDIDNEGDVRVLCNIKPNFNWMGTMLHEFGHAAYDKYIDSTLPYDLRNPAHTFTTEAIAMIFGRLASNSEWMKGMINISDKEVQEIKQPAFNSLKLQQIVFSRWSQVMFRFEKSLYENPDQDLNRLWWDLVEKYQMIKRPSDTKEADWASKIHIASSPCYYHNYLLGELLASQLNHYITVNIIKSKDFNNQSFVGNKEVGKYLIEKVFKPGSKYQWNKMIELATGEKLTAKYYAEQFVNN
ncbi:MAG: hypothetical protein A2X02_06125 [Bacteroidetes bacterium GWF2_29_10]|nr:MAG: hypothetical protein A2X02_06125 [Bacteroidetes bacterium GWF2_29_10]